MPDAFLEAMARHAAGVAVVAARTPGGFRGLTATSVVSASAEPPLVVACVDALTATRDAILAADAFAVSFLNRSQRLLAERFAARAPLVDPRWAQVGHRVGETGAPILDGAVAWLECRVREVHAAGDHDLFVGEVVAAGSGPGDPLILWHRELWTVAPV